MNRNYRSSARFVIAKLTFGLFLFISTVSVYAATVTVNTLNDEAGTGANCSLREAITAANNDTAFGGCPAGSGLDNITFNVSGTIQLSSQLPGIATSMNIVNASGPGNLIIRRNTPSNVQIFLILSSPSIVRIEGVTISNGRSPAGGGIQNGATLTVVNSIITENTAFQFAGGGIYNLGSLFVMDTTIFGNTATPASGNGGAGIENQGRLSVVNSTISGNRITSAGNNCAGGISSNSSLEVKIVNSTITDNEAVSSTCGSGIRSSSRLVVISNSIVAGNRNNANVQDVKGVFTSSGFNLIGTSPFGTGFTNGANGDQVGTMITPIDPMLGPLQDKGGPTPMHGLLGASPAIDAGNDSLAINPVNSAALNEDQRGQGFARIVNKAVDIGAFEVQEIPNTAPMIDAISISAQQGAATSSQHIATVSDKEDAAASMSIAIDGSDSASVNGVSISNIVIDQAGKVSADVAAACSGAQATFILRVSDSGGLYSEDTLTVTVTASRPPVMTVKPFMTFFPPNHKYTSISLDQMIGSVYDDCDANLQSAVTIEQVTSDEADNGEDDGDTINDIAFTPDCYGVLLRIERDGDGNGRVYTVGLSVTDSSGNTSRSSFKVFVPINRNKAATEDTVASTVKPVCK